MGVGITPVSAEGTGERPEDVVVGLPRSWHLSQVVSASIGCKSNLAR